MSWHDRFKAMKKGLEHKEDDSEMYYQAYNL